MGEDSVKGTEAAEAAEATEATEATATRSGRGGADMPAKVLLGKDGDVEGAGGNGGIGPTGGAGGTGDGPTGGAGRRGLGLRRWARPVAALVLVSALALPGAAVLLGGCREGGPAFVAGDNERFIEVEGRNRRYILHLPGSYAGDTAVPLVLVFHGAGGSADGAAYGSGFTPVSERAGFVVVYPEGVDNYWNDWREAGSEAPDDALFVGTLVEYIEKHLRIDKTRIFAVGYSNGAFLVHRLAVELPGLFSAIAPVAGTLRAAIASKSPPWWPVSVLMIHGTRDNSVPWNGDGQGLWRMLSVPATVAWWVRANEGDEEPAVSFGARGSVTQGMRVERHGGGRDGSEVVLCALVGEGHAWPSADPTETDAVVGPPVIDSWAAELIWTFFEGHPAPEVRDRLWSTVGGGG